MKIAKTLLVVCSLILVGVILNAGAASACTFDCQQVGVGCRRCVNLGVFTAITCVNSGPCNCFYTLNNCNGLVAKAQTGLETLIVPADQGVICSASTSANGLLTLLAQ